MTERKNKVRDVDYKKNIVYFCLLFTFGILIYSNSFYGEFVSDDHVFIVNNPAIRNIFDLPSIWRAFNTRFLTGLGFALQYHFHGLDVFGYHIVNILLHISNAFLVFLLIQLTALSPRMVNQDFSKNWRCIATAGSLLFLVHPVQTQAVSFAMQRFTCQATFFYLLTLILFIRWRLDGTKRLSRAAIIMFVFALFSKEMSVTLPLVLLLYGSYFFEKEPWSVQIKRIAPYILLAALFPLVLVVDKAGSLSEMKEQLTEGGFHGLYFLTEINVLVTYLRLFLFPANLTHDYDYLLVQSWGEIRLLLSLCVLIALVTTAVLIRKKKPFLSFCVSWFFIATFVETAVVCIVNRWLIAEHWMYLSMVGLCSGFVYLCALIIRSKKWLYSILAGLIIIGSQLTYLRNMVWQNEILFWQDNIKKTPQHSRVYYALGNAYLGKEDYATAFKYLKKAEYLLKKKEPLVDIRYASGLYNNLGVVNVFLNRDKEALAAFQRSLDFVPHNEQSYFNLGYYYYQLAQYATAHDYLQQAMKLYVQSGDQKKVAEIRQLLQTIKEKR